MRHFRYVISDPDPAGARRAEDVTWPSRVESPAQGDDLLRIWPHAASMVWYGNLLLHVSSLTAQRALTPLCRHVPAVHMRAVAMSKLSASFSRSHPTLAHGEVPWP